MNNETDQSDSQRPIWLRLDVKWLRYVAVTIVAIALLIAGVLMALFTAEGTVLRPIVERIVTAATGREFLLEGNFEADFGRHIAVRADAVKMANAASGSEPFMLSIERPYAVLDIWALTRGQILIRDAKVESGTLLFEQDADGKLNWDLRRNGSAETVKKEPLKSIPLLIENGDLKNVTITLDLPAFETPLPIRIDSAKQVNGEEDILDLKISALVRDRPVELTGSIGPFTTLLVGRDVSFDIDLAGPYLSLKGNGYFDNLVRPEKPEFKIEVSGPEAARVIEGLGLRAITRGPVNLLVSMEPKGDRFQATIDGEFGEFLLDLSADLKALNTIEGLKLDVSASGPDLSVTAALLGVKGLPADAYTLKGQIEESAGTLSFREVELIAGESFARLDGVMPNFPKLRGASLTAGVAGRDFWHFREVLLLKSPAEEIAAPFEITGEISQSEQGEQLFAAAAKIGDIEAAASGAVTDPPDFLGTRLDIEASGPDMSVVDRALGFPGLFKTSFDAQVDVEKIEQAWRVHQSRIDLGDNTAEFEGLVGYEPLVEGTDLTGKYAGNLQILAQYTQLPDLFPNVQYELSFRARATRNGISLDYLDAIIDGDDEVRVSGMVGRLPALDGLNLKVSANAPDLTRLMQRKFSELPLPEGEFELAGRIRKVPLGFQLDKIVASLGANQIRLSGTVVPSAKLAGTDLDLALNGPNLADFLPDEFAENFDVSTSPFDLSTELNITEQSLALKRLAFESARGRIRGDIEIPVADIASGGSFSLLLDGKDLDELIPNTPRFEPASAPFSIRTRGEWDRERILVEQLDVTIDDSKIDMRGEIDLPPDMRASNFVLNAGGSSLSSFGSFNGRPLPDKSFELTASLEGDEYILEIEDLRARVGDSTLTGFLKLDIENKSMASIKINSTKLDLAQFFPATEVPADATPDNLESPTEIPESPPETAEPGTVATGELADDSARLIRNRPIPFEALNRFDVSLDVDASTVLLPRVTLRKFDLNARLTDGDLAIENLSADTEKGSFVSALTLATEDEVASLSFSIDGQDVAFGFGDFSPEDLALVPPLDFAVKLTGAGASSLDLVTSLTGYADMVLRPGKLRNSVATALFGDFLNQLFQRINPFATRDQYTELVCGALFVNLTNGVMTIDPGAVMQTDKMNIFAKGSVNLSTEKLDINFDTAARKGIGISAGDFVNPFVRIGGTLAEPRLRLDATSSAIEGGAAVATGGLTILARSLWGRWFATRDPCGKFTEEAKKAGREINVTY